MLNDWSRHVFLACSSFISSFVFFYIWRSFDSVIRFFLLASCLFFIWLQVQSGELIFFCIYLDCGRTGSCKRRHPKATNKKNINWTHHEPNIVLRFFIYHHRLDWKLFFVNVCNIFYFWRVWMPIALWLGRFIVKESLQNDLFYFFSNVNKW